jgi:hypothetical protein
MFMRYTHYGIGHPTVLRELTRDCANVDPTDSPGSEEIETDGNGEWESDIRYCHGVREDEEGDEDNGGEEDEELECDDDDEDSSVENDLDDEEVGKDVGEDEDEGEEDDYMLSF